MRQIICYKIMRVIIIINTEIKSHNESHSKHILNRFDAVDKELFKSKRLVPAKEINQFTYLDILLCAQVTNQR